MVRSRWTVHRRADQFYWAPDSGPEVTMPCVVVDRQEWLRTPTFGDPGAEIAGNRARIVQPAEQLGFEHVGASGLLTLLSNGDTWRALYDGRALHRSAA